MKYYVKCMCKETCIFWGFVCFVLWFSSCVYATLATRSHQRAVLQNLVTFNFSVIGSITLKFLKTLFHLSLMKHIVCWSGVLTKFVVLKKESWECHGVFSSCTKIYPQSHWTMTVYRSHINWPLGAWCTRAAVM